jgi:hypothetical protein
MNRLARIIDRTRVLKDELRKGRTTNTEELEVLYQRWQLINYALTGSTVCGLLICVVIACLFLGDTANLPLDRYIAGMFVLAMVALIGSFVFLLRECSSRSATCACTCTTTGTRRRKCAAAINRLNFLKNRDFMHDYQRPPTLHRYGMRSDLELALSAGQFRLSPANGFLTLSFSQCLGQEPVRGAGPGRQLPDHPQLRRIRRTPAPRGAAHAAQLGRHRRPGRIRRALAPWARPSPRPPAEARKRSGNSPGARCRRRPA